EIEREEVANRVAVLRAVETMNGVEAAWSRVGRPRFVDGVLERARDGTVGRAIGPRPSRRRHRPGAQSCDHLFPCLGIRARVRGVEAVQREPRRAEPLVVAGDAVGLEDGLRGTGLL